jgi:hypothetical protein
VELARSQIFEIKGKSAPIVVVVNKIDLISSSFEQTVQHQPANSSDETTSTCTHNQHKSSFLCLQMVESLVTCDWGHGFVAASAKDNLNVTQVTPAFYVLPFGYFVTSYVLKDPFAYLSIKYVIGLFRSEEIESDVIQSSKYSVDMRKSECARGSAI